MAALKGKQKKFVDEYLLDPTNVTQAAIRAGYSQKTARFIGSENLTKPHILAAIKKEQDERAERCQVTKDSVLAGIVHCTQESEKQGDYRTALKGYELQGKHIGMFTDKIVADIRSRVVDFGADDKDL